MKDKAIGWGFVAIQGVILVLLVILPGGDAWPTPTWVHSTATALIFLGFAVMIVASLGLGRGLTPTPMPTSSGSLTTTGAYRWVRHPIYTGVLAIVIAMTMQSGNWISLIIGVSAFIFFTIKARWEEERLGERYPGYRDYAAATPRFFPLPGRPERSKVN